MFPMRRILQFGVVHVHRCLQRDFKRHLINIRNNPQVMPHMPARGIFTCTTFKSEEGSSGKEDYKTPFSILQGKLQLRFTCKKCSTRNSKFISKLAYQKGLVIVRCDGCKNNHLIADNLGWCTEEKTKWNIEHIMRQKGEKVRRIRNDEDGYLEAVTEETLKLAKGQYEEKMKIKAPVKSLKLKYEDIVNTGVKNEEAGSYEEEDNKKKEKSSQ